MNKVEKLNDMLMQCLMDDLNDPTKCTPGLYQVVRGVITDNKETLEDIPKEALEFLEGKFTDSIPFKKEVG
tara:strand:- start:1300 stop:1512 length:213 start_codon:yes stop_codon:yes gene_type:complete